MDSANEDTADSGVWKRIGKRTSQRNLPKTPPNKKSPPSQQGFAALWVKPRESVQAMVKVFHTLSMLQTGAWKMKLYLVWSGQSNIGTVVSSKKCLIQYWNSCTVEKPSKLVSDHKKDDSQTHTLVLMLLHCNHLVVRRAIWVWVKKKAPRDRRFWLVFPFTNRVF